MFMTCFFSYSLWGLLLCPRMDRAGRAKGEQAGGGRGREGGGGVNLGVTWQSSSETAQTPRQGSA